MEGGTLMIVYLVQHGEATTKDVDPARPLTGRGQREVVQVAGVAARLGVEVRQIRHSGKARAQETAEILGQALSPQDGVVAVPGLAPNDDVGAVAEALAAETGPLMFVGHLPFLARLAGLLVAGDAGRPVVQFRMGGIVCLVLADDLWQVAWFLTPEMARV
jgi:phosphohistidine phosphatase